MKTTLLITIALLLNTTLLLAEPLSSMVKSVDTWVFVIAEGLLVLAFYGNKVFGDFSRAFTISIGHLDVFMVKIRKKKTRND